MIDRKPEPTTTDRMLALTDELLLDGKVKDSQAVK